MKMLFIRLAAGFLYLGCLSSCTVYKDPVTVSYVDINTGIKVGHDLTITSSTAASAPSPDIQRNIDAIKKIYSDTPPPVPAAAASVPGVKVELCDRYRAPLFPANPKPTEKQMEEIAKLPSNKFNEALLEQMKGMYQYSKTVITLSDTALKRHIATCRMVVVQ